MNRRTATRTAIVTLGLLTLAACVVNLSFTMDNPGIVLKSAGASSTIQEQLFLVDLSTSKEITDHKDNIKSLDLDYMVITITAKDPSSTASTVTGTVTLRRNIGDPPANDIAVGTLTAFPLQVGSTTQINGTPTLDAFLFQQLQSVGKFYVVVNGALDHGVVNVTTDFNLHASIGYDAGIL